VQPPVLVRMDRLASRDKVALQAAPVGGRRFSLDVVGTLGRDPAVVSATFCGNR
jgi:hypothetical protein